MTGTKLKRATINLDGLNLFYLDTLDTGSDLPPMLLLHGRWGRALTWIDFIQRYRDRFRLIAPDQRGHGLSDKPVIKYTGEVMARDAYQLLDRLGGKPAIVVGHSMGGRVASYLTANYPEAVRALIILDETADGPPTESDLPPEKVVFKDGLTDDWPTPYNTYDEAVADLSRRFPLQTNFRYFHDSLVETVDGYDFMFSRYAVAALGTYQVRWFSLLEQIHCPVLLIRATESWCLSAQDAARMRPLIKNCSYFEVSNSDHMVYVDNPDEFYPQLDQFLDRLEE